jgi:hypothetical protein
MEVVLPCVFTTIYNPHEWDTPDSRCRKITTSQNRDRR